MKTCLHCQGSNRDDAKFCTYCGTAFSPESKSSMTNSQANISSRSQDMIRHVERSSSVRSRTPEHSDDSTGKARRSKGKIILLFEACALLVSILFAVGISIANREIPLDSVFSENESYAGESVNSDDEERQDEASENGTQGAFSESNHILPQESQHETDSQKTESGQDTSSESPSDDQNLEATLSEDYSEDYILPNSSVRMLTSQDIAELSDRELMLARNEIYARHGRKFTDDEIRTYFESQSWYYGSLEPEDFSESMLTEIEKTNLQILLDCEKERKGNNVSEELKAGIIYLEDLPYLGWDRYIDNEGDSFIDRLGTRNSPTDINGKEYTQGLECWVARWNYKREASWVWKEWDIGAGYNTLQGEVSVSSNCANKTSFYTILEIIGDGTVLYQLELTPASTYPIAFSVDVSSVKTIRVSLRDVESASGGTSFLLGDICLQ